MSTSSVVMARIRSLSLGLPPAFDGPGIVVILHSPMANNNKLCRAHLTSELKVAGHYWAERELNGNWVPISAWFVFRALFFTSPQVSAAGVKPLSATSR